jgi:diaminopimelate dehydrogenase
MRRLHLAVIGLGRLGRACAAAIVEASDLQLAGVVDPAATAGQALPAHLRDVLPVAHVSELEQVEAALVCVPTAVVLGVARELLQQRIPIVECASLDGDAFRSHRDEIDRIAHLHRVPAVVGAGWNPGAATCLMHLFEILIPKGRTTVTHRPGVSLRHTDLAAGVHGIRGALCTETRDANARLVRYVYVELEPGADLDAVSETIRNDPMFLGEATQVFQVESIAALEEEGHGIVIDRRGTSGSAVHDTLLLEGRFDSAVFTARIMIDAARQIPQLRAGARTYALTRGG